MIEHEVLKLQIVSSLKLVVAGYLFFFWIPRRVLPQDYIHNSLDRIMFNIIHMVAIITLVFPLFIHIRIYGLLFLVIFFSTTKLLFIRYYEKKNLTKYFRCLYIDFVRKTLNFLENPRTNFTSFKENLLSKIHAFKSRLTFNTIIYSLTFLTIMSYALYLRLYRGYISLSGAAPDIYGYYYWNNILKLNVLFDSITAPYMWSGPVLVYTVNMLANLNTVVLYNIFPLLYLSFIFFSIFYFIRKIFEPECDKTASVFFALLVFGILLGSPLAQHFFGIVLGTESPEVIKFNTFLLYSGADPESSRIYDMYPFFFYWRLTTTLPYELAASFFLVNIYFLMRLIETRRMVYLLLYAESLAIIFSIHGLVAIPLFSASLLIFLYAFVTRCLDFRFLWKGILAVCIAAIIGNLWMSEFIIYGIPQNIGAAAPILDKIFKTKGALKDMQQTSVFYVKIVSPTLWLFILILYSFGLLVVSKLYKKLRFSLASVSLISMGVLLVYFAPNLGLPMIVSHSRLQIFLAYTYGIVFGSAYFLIIERGFLKLLIKNTHFKISLSIILILTLLTINLTPRWIDTQEFWESIDAIEYNEFPYLIYKIDGDFQPFTYTIVSYVQQFSEVISKAYHVNTQDFLQTYNPSDRSLPIPTDFVFIFVENEPSKYMGLSEFWYRWRRDIMLKLKDWIVIYIQSHDNIKLWYRSEEVNIFAIDNRAHQDLLQKQREQLKQTKR